MRSLGGFVLMAGLGVGLFYYFPAPVDRDTNLQQAKRVIELRKVSQRQQAAATPQTEAAPASRLSGFAATVPLAAPPRQRIAVAPAREAAPTLKAAAHVEPMAQHGIGPGPAGSLEATNPTTRYELVADIQRELKRVGCYGGRVNGAWNGSTREAMRSFNDRVNATLPVDKPDYLLLTMLKSHDGRNCGESEQPAATVAQTPEVLPWKAQQQQQAAPLFTPLPTSVVSSEPLPGRMAIGAPKQFPEAAPAPLIPGDASPANATAALEPPASAAPPAAAPKRQTRKASSNPRRVAPGTPRYNLMLSLGGVY